MEVQLGRSASTQIDQDHEETRKTQIPGLHACECPGFLSLFPANSLSWMFRLRFFGHCLDEMKSLAGSERHGRAYWPGPQLSLRYIFVRMQNAKAMLSIHLAYWFGCWKVVSSNQTHIEHREGVENPLTVRITQGLEENGKMPPAPGWCLLN